MHSHAVSGVIRDLSVSLSSLWEMTKPRITRLVVFTTALGAAMAPGSISLPAIAYTILGTLLIVASANVLNMFLEEDTDALMERTRTRPLPTGRVSAELALTFGVILAGLGCYVLGRFVNPLACELAMMAFVLYVLVYTPLKAVTQAALYIGAVPGALPPLLGYAGQAGELDAKAWSVFAILFAWQLPHFLAIAIFRRSEYQRAGLKVMPVQNGLPATEKCIVALSVVLLLASLLPYVFGLGNLVYAATALLSGGAFVLYAALGRRLHSVDVWARRVFFASLPHLVVLYGVLAVFAP